MRALVTGGAGFVGGPLVRSLLDEGADVVVVDDLRSGRPAWLAEAEAAGRCRLRVGDLRSPATLEAVPGFAPEVVFHLAALHYVPYCLAHPQETLDVNVLGTDRLLRRLSDVAPRCVVFCSSAAVYGFADLPHREDDELRPGSIYGLSKWLGEELVERHQQEHPGLRAVAARLCNVYGPGETNRHVVPDLLAALRDGERIPLGNLWPQRDYVHVLDVVDALLALARGPAGFEVYNVGTGVGHSVADLVRTLETLTGRTLVVEASAGQARRDDGHLLAAVDRITGRTGWRPAWDFERGLDDLLRRQDRVRA